jgi:hypothetical protein
MNIRQLHKQVGTLLRLRPIPRRVTSNGEILPVSDDEWRLEEILNDPPRIHLYMAAAGLKLVLQSDNVKSYQSPCFLLLRCRLTIAGKEIRIEPIHVLDVEGEEAAREQAMRGPNGTYRYWVSVEGFPDDLRSFSIDSAKRFGHRPSASAMSATWGNTSFVYEGPQPPRVIETLASKHHLRFRCATLDSLVTPGPNVP